jgi:hypothetical protein
MLDRELEMLQGINSRISGRYELLNGSQYFQCG